ncbi:MAG: uncharacterized protein KVP18_000097 [Porospora cf. gigantea A]|uniref:uncharacterized protein n=1 Tax=Porospora cf. gigantea A TaxID=2853593 RepID=UPI003559A4AE|nr:MAG: hypothetical protein KVP18_000097 [Porospora cf. gigantea A]
MRPHILKAQDAGVIGNGRRLLTDAVVCWKGSMAALAKPLKTRSSTKAMSRTTAYARVRVTRLAFEDEFILPE